MRCSNCLSHVEVKFERGVCTNCGRVVDLKFGDGSTALGAKRGLLGLGLVKGVLVTVAGCALAIAIAFALVWYGTDVTDSEPTEQARAPSITAELPAGNRFDDVSSGDIYLATNFPERARVSVLKSPASQSISLFVSGDDQGATTSSLYTIDAQDSLQPVALPEGINPVAMAPFGEKGFVTATITSEDIVINLIDQNGDAAWRRPIFLNGETVDDVSISIGADVILVRVSANASDKTVHYLLDHDGELSALRSFEGGNLPDAIVGDDGSVFMVDMIWLTDPAEQVWSVSNTLANGSVAWKTELPASVSGIDAQVYRAASGDSFVLDPATRVVAKFSADGSLVGQTELQLPANSSAFGLIETAEQVLAVIAVESPSGRDAILYAESVGFDGAPPSRAVFELGLELTSPVLVRSHSDELWLTGRVPDQAGDFVLVALDVAEIVPVSAVQTVAPVVSPPDQTISQPAARVEPTLPAADDAVDERPVVEDTPDEGEDAQTNEGGAEEEPDLTVVEEIAGINWSLNRTAECRFVCIDDLGNPVAMGSTVSLSDGESRPNLSAVQKEACRLVAAIPDREAAVECELPQP